MSPFQNTTSIAILALILMAGLASTAVAKGPESGTLSGPGIEKPVEFSDHRSHTLLDLTGLWMGTPPPVTPPSGELGPAFTVIWLPFGASEEHAIVQQIYLDAEGGPLIHTPEQVGLDGWGVDVIGWFPASDELRAAIEGIIASETGEGREAWTLLLVALAALIGLVTRGRRAA